MSSSDTRTTKLAELQDTLALAVQAREADVRINEEATRMGGRSYAAISCLAKAISTESPSWFNESSPDSGTSPEVL